MEEFERLWFEDDDLETYTSREQCSCETECAKFLLAFSKYDESKRSRLRAAEVINQDDEIRLLRDSHSSWLERGLQGLSAGYVSLDASRPWICYWILHALYLLKREPTHLYKNVISFLTHCQNSSGGFGGGPSQMSHCAPTYAAVLALCTVGTEEALASISRAKMYSFFISLKDETTGAFCMHRDGEIDTRSVYTVLAVSRLLNIVTPELTEGCASFLAACQTYEGGFGGEPGNEAHGGYNFCALAALVIMGCADHIDIDAQERWLLQRQVRLEGGFQGRTNKTVDSCYSFWQGAALALVNIVRRGGSDVADLDHFLEVYPSHSASASVFDAAETVAKGEQSQRESDIVELDDVSTLLTPVSDTSGSLQFNQRALQRYVLQCGQSIESEGVGGLRDKPGKSRDFYHSCYALSGLSIAQSFALTPSQYSDQNINRASSSRIGSFATSPGSTGEKLRAAPTQVFGDFDNVVESTSAVFNIGLPKLHRALQYFSSQPRLTHKEMIG